MLIKQISLNKISGTSRTFVQSDFESMSYSISKGVLNMTIVTKKENFLIDGETIRMTNGITSVASTVSVLEGNKITLNFPLFQSIKTNAAQSYSISGESIMVVLNEPITAKNNTDNFCLYTLDGDLLYSGCYCPKNYNGDVLYSTIVVPEESADYFLVSQTSKGLMVSNDLIYDWEHNGTFSSDIEFYEERGFMDMNVFIPESTDNNLNKEWNLYDEIEEKVMKNLIPSITDNEKQIFSPYICTETISADSSVTVSNKMRVETIEFNMHFRERSDMDTWSISGNPYWNGYTGTDEDWDTTSDKMNLLGFSDSDVKYQKSRIKKSFIRLLFYDSNDVTNQNLLFYSTVHIDGGKLYTSYVKGIIADSSFTIEKSSGDTRIDSKLTINDRTDYSKSSEGFYLYLHPDELVKNVPQSIYMKVEFNHAGYGKTIPFVIPTDDDGNIINSTSSDFPKNYLKVKDGVKINEIDMQHYFKDLFIELKIMHDIDLNKYIYYFPNIGDRTNKKITINLFEPRLNGTTTE